MKCIVVDDEIGARSIVAGLCNRTKAITLVDEFSNGIDAVKYLIKYKVDVMFLDIHMKK